MKTTERIKSLDQESLAEFTETIFYIGRTLEAQEGFSKLNAIDSGYHTYGHERDINFMLEFYVWFYREVAIEASYLTDMYNILDSHHQFYAMYEKFCIQTYLK